MDTGPTVPFTAQETADLAAQRLTSAEQQALPAAVVQGLATPEQQRVAAEGVVGTLPSEVKQDLAAAVVQGLATPEEQRVAAEGVVGTLSSEQQQRLAASVVQGLATPEQQRVAAEGVVGTLSSEQQQQLAESVLGNPDRKTRQNLWYIVVLTMTAAIFVFGSMAFVLIYQKKSAEAPLALATTALGGVVGLIATSPGAARSN